MGRNIEQMFADRDPHEPPPHHVNAAGFVPPIISPSASHSYLSLVSTPSSEVAGVSLPDLISPTLADILPDITNHRSNGNSKLPKPPPLLIQKSSPSSTTSSSLPAIVEKLASLPPLVLKPSNLSQPADLTISLRPQNLSEKKERPPSLQLGPLTNGNVINKKMERLDSILKSVATSGTLVSVASASNNIVPKAEVVEDAPVRPRLGEEILVRPKLGEDVLVRPKLGEEVLVRPRSGEEVLVRPLVGEEVLVRPKTGGRRPTLPGATSSGGHQPPPEEDRKKQRRERNKQAAARCRKRRMDLTCSLQDEVDQWENKVKSLKEELSQLETQKKGLEAILRKHSGSCKVVKSEVDN